MAGDVSKWLHELLHGMKEKKCFICGEYIRTSYYSDHNGHYACGNHDVGTCFVCLSICDKKNSINVPNYGLICPECTKKNIDENLALRLIQYVNNFYIKLGMSFPGHKLYLVSIDEMNKRIDEGDSALGLAYNNYDGIYRICVLKHLSKIAFAGVFAHEILHLWQYGKQINAPKHICEGFCNLGKYLVLSTINKEEAKLRISGMLSDPDPIYGEGFRIVKEVYDKTGWNGVINMMKQYKV